MSNYSSLSYSSIESIAALLLLDSDDVDDIIISETNELYHKLKVAEDEKQALQSCAFRIKREESESSSNAPEKRKNGDDKRKGQCSKDVSPSKRKKYGYWLTAARTPMFADNFLPNMSLNDYKTHFGLSPSQIEKLSKLVEPFYVQSGKQKNLDSFLLVGLSALATKKSCREIGIQLSRSKGHVCMWSQKFNSILAENFTDFIRWPNENVHNVESKFEEVCGFPGVVGAFGACHIPLKYPSKPTDSCFKNNKGFYSLVLSATCDHKMAFTSLSIDTPANFQSTNGMSSKTIQALMTNPQSLIEGDRHILAGSGFPLCNHILTPFLNEGELTDEQITFNHNLKETRKKILKAFSLLRERFGRMYVIDVMDFNRAAASIVAACILHNFILEDEGLSYSEDEIPLECEDVLEIDSNDDPLCEKRDMIAKKFSMEM